MDIREGSFFQAGVRYLATAEDGTQSKVTEQYVVEAFSWTDCEARIHERMKDEINDEFSIPTMKMAGFSAIVTDGTDEDGKYYDCVVTYIVIDEKTSKEKRTKDKFLVKGTSVDNARKNIEEAMRDSMQDYEITCIKETPVVDVFYSTKK